MKKVSLPVIAALVLPLSALHAAPRLNILFFTADDMNYDSTVAICQPVRQTMFCGLYPHRSGSMGFFPVKPEVRTLPQHDKKPSARRILVR